MKRNLLLLPLLAGLLSQPVQAQNFGILRSVIGNGGNSASAPLNRLSATFGQSAVAVSGSQSFGLCSGFWCRPALAVTAVVEPAFRPGMRADVGDPWPNPAGGRVHLTLSLPAASSVHLEVYDLAGRLVRVHALGVIGAGSSDVSWNTGDSQAQPGAGIYFVRVIVNGKILGSRKLLVLP